MTELTLIDADAEANGHPTECTEPAPGSVEQTTSHGITVTVGGKTKEFATVADSDINFSSHSHDYDETDGCHQNSSHSLDPDTTATNITINGSPLYTVDAAVTTDPITGGDVNITANPITTEITQI